MDRQTLLNIGKNNFVVVSRILSITTFEAAAIKRFIQNAKENGLVLNSTCGRKTRSAILLDSGFVILSSIQPETLASRLKAKHAIRTRAKKSIDINNANPDDNLDIIIDNCDNNDIDDYSYKNKRKRKNNIDKNRGEDDSKKIGKKNV